MPKTRALGTTISFGGVAVGALVSIGEVTPESEELDSTTLDSAGGYREYVQGFKDSGVLPLTGYHMKTDAGQIALRAAYLTGTPAAVIIVYPDTTTVTFNAYVKNHTIGGAEVDGLVGFGASLRITGAVAVA